MYYTLFIILFEDQFLYDCKDNYFNYIKYIKF